jgi:hypothetical protein
MTKRMKANAYRLENIARSHALDVRRVLREYNEVTHTPELHPYVRYAKEREVDRIVSQYVKVHRALRKLRKKMSASA